ncbi:hypothetical protein LTR29_015780 [Friedmanniomyces endolithicus]|nr:hypothetical protein LTR29_015780 [Friedmanniomyces endolithicus]
MSKPPAKPKNKIIIALSVDFDAVSGWLGTGAHPDNSTADISQGYFSGLVGVPRLLKLLTKLGLAAQTTWCIPGHSLETFPVHSRAIIDSGAEIALHGYAHEAASQMTAEQEEDVLLKCIQLVEDLTGTKPRGYRAPLYQASERTVALLQKHGFLWDSSFTHYDSTPYLLPADFTPIPPIDFSPDKKAASWMHPSPLFDSLPKGNLVEIPLNWYEEDATPLQFYPHTPNSAGYVDVRGGREDVAGSHRVDERGDCGRGRGDEGGEFGAASGYERDGACDWNGGEVFGVGGGVGGGGGVLAVWGCC